ncbi:LLM class flavin-dependent oxidoreductase [Nocardioides euryhalodurans]|uniref:LLM class flavin-dependent oxidoreductase n=1 Tax=Nocardioides euryhalodurans TaxID=2518370 RepID=A0A4P7GLU1_9ACTN|nr:LLM class flavin-dependent oxidoreductase [Nocardioides euryhalodurans]QBR92804.1 LLM class flavin-dependent oxidoreductase [Nocardioides euryhalodurans]
MDLDLHWFLPTTGDGRTLVGGGQGVPRAGVVVSGGAGGTASQFRAPDLDYLTSVATTADRLGFTGVLTPTGTFCEDAWLVTSALIRETNRLRFLVAFRPGLVSPTLAAQMASTFQRLSGGRVALNVVTGGEPAEQARFGDHLSHDERYARTDEFLAVVRGAWGAEPFDLDGDHYRVVGARTREVPDPLPPIYFGGSSPAAGPVAARHTDVYLTWGEPPAQVAEKVRWIRGLAEEQGRHVRFGIRMHVIARDSAAEAWRHAQWLVDTLDPADVAKAQQAMAASESVGQQRMSALRQGDGALTRRSLEVAPNLWSGVGLVRGGAGTALVGSHEEVADRIEEYAALGIEEFILSGYPHLEEAHWVAEGVMPVLRNRGRLAVRAA